jgi:hypothetical protein
VAYLASDDLQGRHIASEGSAKAADYIVRHFQQFGLASRGDRNTYFQSFPWNSQSGRNLIAVMPGAGKLAHQAVIVSAHYDHVGVDPKRLAAGQDAIFNGADDNASGVAALLLIAEALRSKAGEFPTPRRSVVFIAFDGKERGSLGSRYYHQRPCWPLEKTAAIVNFDLIGRLRQGKVYGSDVQSSSVLEKRFERLAEKCGLRADTRLSGLRGTDHVPFLDSGIPSVTLTTGLHADYHQVSDELQKIDSAGAARVAWLAYRLVAETVADPRPIAFQQPRPAYDLQNLLRTLRRQGIVPRVWEPGPGPYPKISRVIPGSPAEKAGIRAGDRITALNGQTFNRLEDVIVVWSQLQLDDGLRLSLLRDGKQVELTLPAELFTGRSGPVVRPLGDGLFEVTFSYRPKQPVKSVHLAGTFNEWKMTAHKLEGPDKEGRFTTKLKVKKGKHEYKFVLDGQTWETDPENVLRTGPYRNSVLHVGVEP